MGRRRSTIVIGLSLLLILLPIPVLPPFVGTLLGGGVLLVGLVLRFLGL